MTELERFYGGHMIHTVTSGPARIPLAEIAPTLYLPVKPLIDYRDTDSVNRGGQSVRPTLVDWPTAEPNVFGRGNGHEMVVTLCDHPGGLMVS